MDAREAVNLVIGGKGDETVLDYVIGSLEDEDFHWEEAYEALGEMLVSIVAGERCRCRRLLCFPQTLGSAVADGGIAVLRQPDNPALSRTPMRSARAGQCWVRR
jgi:hypothetical protein